MMNGPWRCLRKVGKVQVFGTYFPLTIEGLVLLSGAAIMHALKGKLKDTRVLFRIID